MTLLKSRLLLIVLTIWFLERPARAAPATPSCFLAFVTGGELAMVIGQYQPHRGWIQAADFTELPKARAVFSLYRMEGKVAQVALTDRYRPDTLETPLSWAAGIERWVWTGEPYALAVQGTPDLLDGPAQALPLEDPALEEAVSKYLNRHGLRVPKPLLTEAFQVKLDSRGTPGTLICAHNDASAVRDDQPAAIYALALLWLRTPGKERLIPLAQQTSFKLAYQSYDEHEHFHGTRDFYRIIACVDINGDGRKEIVLYRAKAVATVIDVFSWDGSGLRKVLSSYKHLYN
jgi:hypothetical protein